MFPVLGRPRQEDHKVQSQCGLQNESLSQKTNQNEVPEFMNSLPLSPEGQKSEMGLLGLKSGFSRVIFYLEVLERIVILSFPAVAVTHIPCPMVPSSTLRAGSKETSILL